MEPQRRADVSYRSCTTQLLKPRFDLKNNFSRKPFLAFGWDTCWWACVSWSLQAVQTAVLLDKPNLRMAKASGAVRLRSIALCELSCPKTPKSPQNLKIVKHFRKQTSLSTDEQLRPCVGPDREGIDSIAAQSKPLERNSQNDSWPETTLSSSLAVAVARGFLRRTSPR
jgi:hypothetical protein